MKPHRTIPPTAAPLSFWDLLRSVSGFWGGRRHRARLVDELKFRYAVRAAFLLSSGKAALTVILKALSAMSRRRRVIIPAYTCFSVPSAIVKAGLEVMLCDVEPETLDFKFAELEGLLDENVLCVVSTHLFGRSADVERVKQLCEEKGIIVVEDAAQAMGGRANGRLLGTIGDVGFFSLGRGKNITCGTGGIILTDSPAIGDAVESECAALSEVPRFGAFRNWLELLIMRIFIHPRLYWLPAGLPFLGLGETRFYTDYPILLMDEVRARLLAGWEERLELANQQRFARAKCLMEGLDLARMGVKPIVGKDSLFLRLPVLVRDRLCKEAVCRLSNELGAGLSPNYPATIQEIPQLAEPLADGMYPGAHEVVDRLVTLPTHQFVSRQDRLKVDRVLAIQEEFSVPGDTVDRDPASQGPSRRHVPVRN